MQTIFRNEHQKTMVSIISSHNWLSEKIKKFIEPEGITSQKYNVRRILRGSTAALTTLQITAHMMDKMGDVSRIVNRLLPKGFMEKRISLKDKRLIDIIITDRHQKLLLRFEEKNDELNSILSALSIPKTEMLNGLPDKMRND